MKSLVSFTAGTPNLLEPAVNFGNQTLGGGQNHKMAAARGKASDQCLPQEAEPAIKCLGAKL